jgi:hypothetical protein
MPYHRKVRRIAYFVSPHGFGHAARACAVMDAVHRLDPEVEFDVYTKVPRWFFADSLSGPWTYHSLLSDIGFVQKTPLEIDLPETIFRLDRFYPPEPATVETLARKVTKRGCGLVVCDIAPLGIMAAKASGVPSVLVENFTWDWLYEAYEGAEPAIGRHVRYLRGLFALADYRVQTEPVCRSMDVDLVTGPISRRRRVARSNVRKMLSISGREKVVLLTMGGIPGRHPHLENLQAQEGIRFLIPGAARIPKQRGNLILLPHRSEYFHPDLVEASDVVVGKVGYSTLAEVYRSGAPFGYLIRKDFRESQVLVAFAEAHMPGMPVTEEEFENGRWISRLRELLALPRVHRRGPDETKRVALFLRRCLRIRD